MNDPCASTSPTRDAKYRISVKPVNATSGSVVSISHLGPRVTEQARTILQKIPDEQMAQAVKNLIIVIEEAASAFVAAGGDIYALSPARASLSDDGSVSLEWISPDYRLGFNIEANPNDSGWYLVTSKRLNEIWAYGFLSELDNRALASLLMNFVLANS